ncbi:hypothetical protein TcasGA2_TC032966 [Tribolium castaneum]|uniref:Uncharacterized protein n=1 Tax=Tribolium castaneum TaxID=7070 RepID=A0A139WA08_TRICA|nr:hypothetical protein TcasGA2_TC032966 [Tribolium castaneum]
MLTECEFSIENNSQIFNNKVHINDINLTFSVQSVRYELSKTG